ncbi:MAG: FAD-dependent oxidoreductase [Saprospiraceae bacterium]|nr:FAD-dependent oxidoreductase [Saprospiraceae bacterium]
MFKYDLIVIGGGILGLSHAYHSLQKGLKVLLIEKNT